MIAIKYHSTVKNVKSIIWIISSSEEGMEENWSKSKYDSCEQFEEDCSQHTPSSSSLFLLTLSVLCTTTKPTMMAKLLVLS